MISNEILLLKIIDANGRISLLRDRGLSHSQVAMLIKKQVCEGNIIVSEEDIKLTHKGTEILIENLSKIAPRKKDQWILPQMHLYQKPLPIGQIVLPKNKKL